MPVYEKGRRSGRWQVVVQHKGNRQEWVVRGSRAEAEEFEARMRLEMVTADPDEDRRTVPTFSVFCVSEYKAHAELALREGTWKRRQSILAILMEEFGDKKLSLISSKAIDRYSTKRRKAGLRNISINNELRVLRRILRFAKKNRKVPLPDVAIEFLKEDERRVRTWTLEEIERFLTCLAEEAPHLIPIILTLLNTGMRKGEALALTWDQVDLHRMELVIQPSDEWRPKSGRPREVPIAKVLLPYLSGPRAHEKWVFPAGTGQRWAVWPKNTFDRVRKKAGLQGGPHTLRHTFASHFLAKQPDLGLLAEILGHTETSVTRLYAHMLKERLARARDVVSISMPGTEDA